MPLKSPASRPRAGHRKGTWSLRCCAVVTQSSTCCGGGSGGDWRVAMMALERSSSCSEVAGKREPYCASSQHMREMLIEVRPSCHRTTA